MVRASFLPLRMLMRQRIERNLWQDGDRFAAKVSLHGVREWRGGFDTIEAARAARDDLEAKRRGTIAVAVARAKARR